MTIHRTQLRLQVPPLATCGRNPARPPPPNHQPQEKSERDRRFWFNAKFSQRLPGTCSCSSPSLGHPPPLSPSSPQPRWTPRHHCPEEVSLATQAPHKRAPRKPRSARCLSCVFPRCLGRHRHQHLPGPSPAPVSTCPPPRGPHAQ